jgi:hypothetical protein
MFMSLIHTAELHEANVFDYLLSIMRHGDAVAKNPEKWLPWNYTETLARLKSSLQPSIEQAPAPVN